MGLGTLLMFATVGAFSSPRKKRPTPLCRVMTPTKYLRTNALAQITFNVLRPGYKLCKGCYVARIQYTNYYVLNTGEMNPPYNLFLLIEVAPTTSGYSATLPDYLV